MLYVTYSNNKAKKNNLKKKEKVSTTCKTILCCTHCKDSGHKMGQEVIRDAYFSYSSLCALIGGWENTKSVIRKQMFGLELAENISPMANCTVSKAIWIDWTNSIITVGEGYSVGTGSLLSYTDLNPSPVNRFRISTGYGASGEWNFGESFQQRDWPPCLRFGLLF